MDKTKRIKILALLGISACALLAYRVYGWDQMGPVNSLHLDLSKPDALIVTKSLASLPRDLLTIPLARDVLKEDFLFYYEQNEDRLGLKGSLRRIAYEHELGWGDQLIRAVLDEPAEVALWRDADGSLKHFAIAVSRSSFTHLLEEAGKVALKDSQLRVAGDVRVDGDKVTVFALDYAYNRTLLFAARGNRMVILSHPGMVYGGKDNKRSDGTAETTLANMLTADATRQHQFLRRFQMETTPVESHSIAVKTDFLSFSYQPFFGSLDALRFDFGKAGWQTRALVDAAKTKPGAYDFGALWPVLPHNPAACFALPVDWAALKPVFGGLDARAKAPVSPLADQLSGPAAVCWYASSRLYTPVFVATKKTGASSEALFENLFDLSIGRVAGSELTKSGKNGEQLWQRKVLSRFGNQGTGEEAFQLPTMATKGQMVVFSPDDKLVEQVLAVLRKKAPAAGDSVPDAAHTVALIGSSALASLIQKEAFEALPENSESVLRGAANQHLVPRLAALKKYPPYRLVMKSALPATGVSWVTVDWQAGAR